MNDNLDNGERMPLRADLGPEIAFAGALFDRLREGSRGQLGVTRASYGAGEQMADDLIAGEAERLDLERRVDAALFGTSGVPTAMIFVRNAHGSHYPDEAEMADFGLALRLLVEVSEDIDRVP